MEIERKFTLKSLPDNLESYPSHHIEQVYLNYNPVVRARKQDDEYYLTYKGSGMMVREEYNLPLTREAYEHLLPKIDGLLISKTRYLIPLSASEHGLAGLRGENSLLTAELDIFEGPLAPLSLVEVEFESVEEANAFVAPDWFGEDVTEDGRYHNSNMSKRTPS